LSKTYWHSARTPGLRENIGSGLSSLPNRIVGPGITATQPTPSEQPIWRGDRLEFAGDDFLNVAGFAQDPDDLTIAGVVSFDGYGSTRCIFGHRDGTGAFVLVFYFSVDDSFQIFVRDSGGNDASAQVPKPATGARFAFAATASLRSTAEVSIHASTGQDSGFVASTGDYPSSKQSIGRDPEFGTEHEGGIYEIVHASTTDVKPARLQARLEQRWAL
jgi:hypothetical protein